LDLCLKVIAGAHSHSFRSDDGWQEQQSQANTPEGDVENSYFSGADTVSGCSLTFESEDDTDCEVVATKHSGNPEEFQEHVLGFLGDFLEYMADAEPEKVTETFHVPLGRRSHEWSYCMLVRMRFAKEAHFDECMRRDWLTMCCGTPTQEKMLVLLDSILGQASFAHGQWKLAEFEQLVCNKEYVAAIFGTDMLVRRHLKGHAESVKMWVQNVVDCWFENSENAFEFITRANRFLKEHFLDGIRAGNHVVTIQSYVAFLWMSKLASLLIFEHVEVRKFENVSGTGDAVPRADASHNLLHGFISFISSVRRVFGLHNAGMPARSAVPTIVQGLQCLAHLQDPKGEMLGPFKTARELVHDVLQVLSAPAQATTLYFAPDLRCAYRFLISLCAKGTLVSCGVLSCRWHALKKDFWFFVE